MERKWYTKQDLRDKMSNCYDNLDLNIDYIENNNQQKIAKENNERLHYVADFCRLVLNQIGDIESELRLQKVIADVEYSKGYFRITRGDKVLYKKFDKTQMQMRNL